MAVLREYHEALGDLIHRFEGTLERFTGDGLMVFFNDPVPCDDAAAARGPDGRRDARAGAGTCRGVERRGHDLGFGIGIAQGYATLGRIGFEGRFDYAAIGSVTNLAARLCAPRRRLADPGHPARRHRAPSDAVISERSATASCVASAGRSGSSTSAASTRRG